MCVEVSLTIPGLQQHKWRMCMKEICEIYKKTDKCKGKTPIIKIIDLSPFLIVLNIRNESPYGF
jgi:hypothetical protein